MVSNKNHLNNCKQMITMTTFMITVSLQLAMLPTGGFASDTGTGTNLQHVVDQSKVDEILKDVYATVSKNIGINSRKLNLEDFSWGIFSGTKGRLQGFDNFQLINNDTVSTAEKRKLNLSFEFTVPTLAAIWEKSNCLGYSCVMTMELDQAVFVLRIIFDADECEFEHLAFLKNYRNAKCFVSYLKTSSIPSSFVQTTVKLLSKVMNTNPFQKIIKDNVNYALLQLPLFSTVDIKRICDAYQFI